LPEDQKGKLLIYSVRLKIGERIWSLRHYRLQPNTAFPTLRHDGPCRRIRKDRTSWNVDDGLEMAQTVTCGNTFGYNLKLSWWYKKEILICTID